jgi:hypothetical protein
MIMLMTERHRLVVRVRVRARVTLWLAVYRQSLRLGVKPLEDHEQIFFKMNPCCHSPCVTSSLMRGWVCLLWICLAFVKCKYRTYSMILKILPFFKDKVMLRPTVSRPVCFGVKSPSGAQDQISITVRQLWVCWCGAPSLTRLLRAYPFPRIGVYRIVTKQCLSSSVTMSQY